MKAHLLVISLLLGSSGIAVADPMPAPSFWKNQRGSELRIVSVSKNGRISGTFTNYATNYQCQGIPYAAVGVTSPATTTFAVNFVKCRTVTRWTGTILGLVMSTQWVLRYGGQTDTGYDFFYRIN
jgi:avidin family protein